MSKLLLITTLFLSLNAYAGDSQTGGLGRHPFLIQASFTAEPIKSGFEIDLFQASTQLSNGDIDLALDILDSFNPKFAVDIIKANPQLSKYKPSERNKVVAKMSSGISFLDQSKIFNGEEAVKSLSRQNELLEHHSELDLDDLIKAIHSNL